MIEYETKEIASCPNCPMFNRQLDICTHWGSPFGNKIDPFEYAPPEWCPIRKKPLLLQVIIR